MASRRVAIWSAVVALACACHPPKDPGEVLAREGEPDVFYVDEDDVEMNQAMERARQSLDAFVLEIQSPRPGVNYSVKARFDKGEFTEYIWVTTPVLEAGNFRGSAGNEGIDVDVHFGKPVVVERSRVVDWLAVDGNTYRGGFSIRVLRDRASTEERARLDAEFGATPE